MKINFLLLAGLLLALSAFGQPEPKSELLEKHTKESSLVADDQDELSADVQQLTIEQTVPKVIELLTEVEEIMDEVTDSLGESNTGGETIAAQTEVIEKIFDAAKERQKEKGSGKSGGAMMDMMERMKGEGEGEGKEKGKGKGEGQGEGEGEGESETGGQGQEGDSDSANAPVGGENNGKTEARRVPKAAGNAGRALPPEFQQALDAYNRGVEEKLNK